MKERLLFIYNPNAGRAKIKSQLSGILSIFAKAGYEIIACPTQQKDDARLIAKEYAQNNACDIVACSGGDGTLNEVVNGLMVSNPNIPVGYIPSGTTNDFGYSLNIPKDMMKAAEIVVRENTLTCDVGSMNQNYFTYTAAFGLFTDVSYDTPQNTKNVLGRMAYILSGVTKLHSIKSFHLKVQHDDIAFEDNFIVGMVANSNSVAGFRGITGRKVQLDDGVFELILIRTPHNLVEISTIVNDLLHSDLSSKYIYYKRISSVIIESETEMPWTLDGEYGGTTRTAEIKIHKQAIPYICNRKSSESEEVTQ